MGPLPDIIRLIVQTLGSLYLFIVIVRFLLQVARADFYNPISQTVVRLTNPLLIPLRKVIPGIYGIDLASILLAVAISWVATELTMLAYGGFLNPATVLVWVSIGLLSFVTSIYFWGLLISIVFSWIAPYSHHPALQLLRQLMEPAMAPFRRLLPPMGGIDITPIFAFLTLQVINIVIGWLAGLAGMTPSARALVIGI